MKVFVAGALAAVSEAGHFRAISYGITQNIGGQDLTISRSMEWRRFFSGYPGGCTAEHVSTQTPALYGGIESCRKRYNLT